MQPYDLQEPIVQSRLLLGLPGKWAVLSISIQFIIHVNLKRAQLCSF